MNNFILRLSALFLLLAMSLTATAQKYKEGVIEMGLISVESITEGAQTNLSQREICI